MGCKLRWGAQARKRAHWCRGRCCLPYSSVRDSQAGGWPVLVDGCLSRRHQDCDLITRYERRTAGLTV